MVFLIDSAFSSWTEGRWVLVEDHPWQCEANGCGFQMGGGEGNPTLFDKMLINEGATPRFTWESSGLQSDTR